MRDRVMFRGLQVCLRCHTWAVEKLFVAWYSDWICELLVWGGRCDCHEEDYNTEESHACKWEGRRLKTAYTHTQQRLKKGLGEARLWTPDRFESMNMLNICHACVESSYIEGLEQVKILDALPILPLWTATVIGPKVPPWTHRILA